MESQNLRFDQSLYEIAAAINSTRKPEEVLDTLVESVAKALGVRGCSLMLLTPDKNELHHTAAFGLSEEYVQKGPVVVDKSISEVLSLAGKVVIIRDATSDERVQYRLEAEHEGIACILSVPMMLREDVIGVIRVYASESCQFSDDDIQFVGAVANLGAIALENASLYQSLKGEHKLVTQQLLEWEKSMGVWPERLRGRR
ncbi:MAG: GAF domain-containing protein [Dehalococcoidia bacterium]|nr:GAF domain-containing protein [Dehalococcoidia bacterium]